MKVFSSIGLNLFTIGFLTSDVFGDYDNVLGLGSYGIKDVLHFYCLSLG
jgi:hypothetical protein